MSLSIAPTYTQSFHFPDDAEGCGCCGFFIFRRREVILDQDSKKLVRVFRANRAQREQVANYLMESGKRVIAQAELGADIVHEDEIRKRAGSALNVERPITIEKLKRFAEAIDGIIDERLAEEVEIIDVK